MQFASLNIHPFGSLYNKSTKVKHMVIFKYMFIFKIGLKLYRG